MAGVTSARGAGRQFVICSQSQDNVLIMSLAVMLPIPTLPQCDRFMTPQQFRACIAQLRWSQARIAAELGVESVRVRKWSAGADPIPEIVVTWIRDLANRIEHVYALCPPPVMPKRYARRQKSIIVALPDYSC